MSSRLQQAQKQFKDWNERASQGVTKIPFPSWPEFFRLEYTVSAIIYRSDKFEGRGNVESYRHDFSRTYPKLAVGCSSGGKGCKGWPRGMAMEVAHLGFVRGLQCLDAQGNPKALEWPVERMPLMVQPAGYNRAVLIDPVDGTVAILHGGVYKITPRGFVD